MKPLAEIVAEIEADKRAGYPLEIPKADLLRLCAAFRAAEKMRDGCGMAGHNMKPHGDCLVCSAMAAFDAAVRGDGE